MSAARSGSVAAIEQVIATAASEGSEVKGSGGNKVALNALVTAIFDGQSNLAEVLVDKAAIPVDDAGVTGNTPLMWASLFCKTDVITSLLNLGANPELKNKDGKTPMALAKARGCVNGVTLLRKAGATR